METVRLLRLFGRVAALGAILFGLNLQHSAFANAKVRADIASDAACTTEDTLLRLAPSVRGNPLAPPKRDGRPVPVEIGLFVERIDSISEIDHSFDAEVFLELVWCDPRLAYGGADAPERIVYLEDRAHAEMQSVWWPDVAFVNHAGPPDRQQEELLVFPDGTVVYEERVAVTLRARYDFTRFPFDAQRLTLEIESFAWPSSDMTLRRDEEKIGFAEGFNIPSWSLTGYTSEIRNVQEVRDRDTFSELLVTIDAERVSAPYVYRLILPLMLIVAVSWSVFWLRALDTGRFAVTFTTILTVVAFNFVVTDKLPNVPEVTYLETLFGFSFLFLVLVVIQNTAVDRLEALNRTDSAERLDRASRIAFPALYALGTVAVTAGFGLF